MKVGFLMKNSSSKSDASVDWVDRETLRYSKNGFSVFVWVDYEPAFFNSGRIIKANSIVKWDVKPDGVSDFIDEMQKKEIVENIKMYFGCRNEKCRVEG